MSPYVDIFRTSVDRLSYDYVKRLGSLHMPADCSCDMSSCVALFSVIDPDVRRIETYAGSDIDTIYVRNHRDWVALLTRLRS